MFALFLLVAIMFIKLNVYQTLIPFEDCVEKEFKSSESIWITGNVHPRGVLTTSTNLTSEVPALTLCTLVTKSNRRSLTILVRNENGFILLEMQFKKGVPPSKYELIGRFLGPYGEAKYAMGEKDEFDVPEKSSSDYAHICVSWNVTTEQLAVYLDSKAVANERIEMNKLKSSNEYLFSRVFKASDTNGYSLNAEKLFIEFYISPGTQDDTDNAEKYYVLADYNLWDKALTPDEVKVHGRAIYQEGNIISMNNPVWEYVEGFEP